MILCHNHPSNDIEPSKAIRPIVPGVYIKDAADMVETSNESVHLVITGAPQFELKPDQKPTSSEHWTGIQAVMDEINRVLVPGGVLAISIPDSVTHYGEDKKRIESALNRYQSFLNKHKIYLTDIIHCVAPKAYREKKALKGLSEGLRHTTYNVQSFCSPVYIFRKESPDGSNHEWICRSNG
jgi:hypothetical protein